MSKMKHLLRKLHIGGGLSDQPHHGLADARPGPVLSATNPSPNSDPSSISAAMGRFGDVGDGGVDFGFLEEEFQVQLAMAISASDPGAREVREDPESAQIDAAKLMSLGCSGSVADNGALLSLQYWSYNVLNYDEKVMDGFYDVHGVTSNSVTQGKMPLLVDLQAISIVDSDSYDVVFVNRLVDPDLQQLERKVYNVLMECRHSEQSIYSLVQKVADMVVNRMGGPVGDTDEMLKRWSVRISKLRSSLNTIVLPLGCLDVGLSRHRALLFKVLADRINLPCMLVKGSYYTGADDGAVNLIKMDNGSEYIIDLMGAPGALIPAEVPSSHLLNSGLEISSFSEFTETSEGSCLVPNKGIGTSVVSSHHDKVSEVGNLLVGPVSSVGIHRREDKRNVVKETSTKKFENEFGRLIPALHESGEGSSGISGEASPAENMQVTNVSEYAIQSNFSMPLNTAEREVVSIKRSKGLTATDAVYVGDSCQNQLQNELDLGKKSAAKLMETPNRGMLTGYNGHTEKINFGEDAEWEIPWEDLHIGERIGIGSYGEVYHADWNGTEVAVKKFLDQDFSGDSLVQFKSEVEIMLRLRHPNVVLFMGAVTRSPHFSILTEFLPGGSLYRLLHRPNHHLDERRRMRMALDVAKGMNHLHTSHPTIVHRDLKSPNLLVDKNWVVKVCDFGLSRTKHHTFLSSKSTAGTPEWMAPEVLRNEPANEKCDVYSFGVILWELATLRIPWKGLNPMQVVGAVGFQHRRLEIPEDVDPAVAQIIRDCWLMEPHLRPSFAQLMHRLRRLQHLVVERTTSSTFME